MSDAERLAQHVDVWWEAVQDLLVVLEALRPEEWARPTDLPGWDVRACAAHTAHLESVLAGSPEETADVGDPPHLTGPMGRYTEVGVVNRRGTEPGAIIAEIREATTKRYEQLRADPPTDGSTKPEVVFGGVPWSWETLLRNRPLDVWMHAQDIRRAVGMPGGMDTAAAQHTADYLVEGFGYVLAKRVGAPAGTTAVLEVAGSAPAAYAVSESGRGERLAQVPADPDVRLRMDRDSFIVLAGGRRTPPPETVEVVGDHSLGQQVLDAMATTP